MCLTPIFKVGSQNQPTIENIIFIYLKVPGVLFQMSKCLVLDSISSSAIGTDRQYKKIYTEFIVCYISVLDVLCLFSNDMARSEQIISQFFVR